MQSLLYLTKRNLTTSCFNEDKSVVLRMLLLDLLLSILSNRSIMLLVAPPIKPLADDCGVEIFVDFECRVYSDTLSDLKCLNGVSRITSLLFRFIDPALEVMILENRYLGMQSLEQTTIGDSDSVAFTFLVDPIPNSLALVEFFLFLDP